jgi:hypothetical protein
VAAEWLGFRGEAAEFAMTLVAIALTLLGLRPWSRFRRMRAPRNHPAWWAFIVHRISGVALALFLPAHFLAMGLALRGEAPLDEFLRWSEQPLVVAGEWVLVMLLAAHLAGGSGFSRWSSCRGAIGRRRSRRSRRDSRWRVD